MTESTQQEKKTILKMTTLKKISHLTGFSISTISKALNDKNDINVDTKKIIQEFALKTNYRPNKNALALRSSKSSIIAIIVPRINNALYSEMLYDIQKCASKKGYRIMLFQSFEEVSKIQHYLEDINDGSVDAAIVLTINKNIESEISSSRRRNLPTVFIQINHEQSNFKINENCAELFEKLIKQIS
ncbi:MAG: LacI family transcriptional regulator [Bacteroidetes bacterium HGW-Bacteroidetes-23]|nr:MAG: LacI family transcriptional regulator [Bacteroidetes bacterium HGW-Bacteroidetes-23]